jgi:CheY-like chemotaxis protein
MLLKHNNNIQQQEGPTEIPYAKTDTSRSTSSSNIKREKIEDKDLEDSLLLGAREKCPKFADSQIRVLVAEDNLTNQLIIKSILQAQGFFVDVVPNGKDALTAVSTASYDLILMDVAMPVMNGMTATENIRELPGTVSNIPIVALTTQARSGDRERILASGMDDYLTKPIDIIVTLNCIDRWTKKDAMSLAR